MGFTMKRTVCILLFLLCGITSRANAALINFVGEGKVGVVTINSGLGSNLSVYAGELEWAWAGNPSVFFYTYCVDANHWAQWTEDVNVEPSSTIPNFVPNAGGKAAWLISTYAPWIHSYGSGDDAAALQVAVWTALYDAGSTLNSGPFTVTANSYVTTKAGQYLTALYSAPGGPGTYYTSTALWLDATDGSQGQMPIPSVPEPASLLLLGSGLFWAAAKTRRWGQPEAKI